ncbi:MAG: glucan 1,4-alpha-glucosidase, partial [Acidobacteriota bacterium]|nr:glucan 1,4-alpha-glucosidase [Acidobacteriota bacterium]
GRLIPEQVWDSADIPERELWFGKPSGSACPLVWAHSEYIKLRRSLRDGKVFDLPPQTVQRYIKDKTKSAYFSWRFNNKCLTIPRGKSLRLALVSPATVHWSFDGWQTARDSDTRDTGLGLFTVDLPTSKLDPGHDVLFTFFWHEAQVWEGKDFCVFIEN